MSWLKALCIAFSLYSRIPVPNFEWKDRELRLHMVFFPWIGAVIGALLFGWLKLTEALHIGSIAYVLIGVAIPLLVTGGFHADGYMDCMDAFRSYKDRDEKLRILKDPHVGAFAVLMLVVLLLIYGGAYSQIKAAFIPVLAGGFFLSRTLSALAVMFFPAAKKDGMLYSFSRSAHGEKWKLVTLLTFINLAICFAFMLIMNPAAGALSALAAGLCFLYYHYKSKKEFGGITGDTAGFFVCICETAIAFSLAGCSFLFLEFLNGTDNGRACSGAL